MPISLALVLTVLLAGAAAVGLVALALSQFSAVDLATRRLGTTEVLEIVKISLAVVAGIGGVVALVVAYRKQRVSEAGETREQAKLFNERFTTAAGQLGNDFPAVRLAGVHALAALADDWEGGRQMCIDVLCAYLRMPPGHLPDASTAPAEHTTWLAMGEVRATIWRLITAHLKADARKPWHGADMDFTGVSVTHSIDFSRTVFPSGTVLFDRAKFSGGRVRFDAARFSGGHIGFYQAEFSGSHVQFTDAEFSSGQVWFTGAVFSGGAVAYNGARFYGQAGFSEAKFSGSKVTFTNASFADGTIWFDGAMFTGGRVAFDGAMFNGSAVHFERAVFDGGKVTFSDVADWSRPPTGLPSQVPGLLLPPARGSQPGPDA
ncbi:pentapeptide repeat-containing protein [Nonomuraea sp. NPDC050202]|uniref:pentapeptide repeat-containing protein n=1 Tax=Nonomuraea sp. NPDC050202 TaxID=3155035 RepID=UPI0034049A7C